MLSAVLAVCLAPQQLEVAPSPSRVGETVRVALRGEAAPLAGVRVTFAPIATGASPVAAAERETGQDGAATFVAEIAGAHEVVAEAPGIRIVRVHRVLPERRRWWAALVTVPLGIALAWRHWRHSRAESAAANAGRRQ